MTLKTTIAALLCSTALMTGACKSALATDLVKRPVPSSSAVSAPAYNWTGFWVRAAGGYEMSNTEAAFGGVTIDGLGGDGLLYDVAVGADLDLGGAVGGLWCRYGWHDADFRVTAGALTVSAGVDTAWACGARLGLPMGRVMPYVLAGYGKAHMQLSSSVPLGVPELPDTNFWTLGGGFEIMATKNFRLGAEVRANLMDSQPWATTGVTIDQTTVEAVAFVSFAFGGGIKLPD